MKIALIAMSGVRAFNEELTRLGMTMPGFMERGEVIAALPSLSLLSLADTTKSAGHTDPCQGSTQQGSTDQHCYTADHYCAGS